MYLMAQLGSRRKPRQVSTQHKCFLNTKNPLGSNRVSKVPARNGPQHLFFSHRTLTFRGCEEVLTPSSSHGFALLLEQKSPSRSALILDGVKQELAGGSESQLEPKWSHSLSFLL